MDSYSVDGGGRIIKDKLFFFGAFEHVKRDLPGVVTVSAANIAALGLPASYGDPIPFRQSVYFYMGKADWQINAKNRLSVRYMHHANDSPYNNSTIGGTQPGFAIVQLRGPLACGRGATGLHHQRPHRQRTARTGGVPRTA